MAKEINIEKIIQMFEKASMEERLSALKKLGEWIMADIQKQKVVLDEAEAKIKTA